MTNINIRYEDSVDRYCASSTMKVLDVSALLSRYDIQWQLYNNPIITGLLFFQYQCQGQLKH